MYTTSALGLVAADPPTVYRALVDPLAVARWRVPDGMRGHVHELDARVGGRIRMTLTYDDPTRAGKSQGASDTYSGVFREVVAGERLVEEVSFESDDPDLRGVITMTTSLRAAPGGTEVEIRMDGVPDAVPPEQNRAGTEMALAALARVVADGLVG